MACTRCRVRLCSRCPPPPPVFHTPCTTGSSVVNASDPRLEGLGSSLTDTVTERAAGVLAPLARVLQAICAEGFPHQHPLLQTNPELLMGYPLPLTQSANRQQVNR